MFPGFHPVEFLIILVVALLIFGPKKLPELGDAIGKSIKQFKKATNADEIEEPEETKHNKSLAELEREIASKRAAAEAESAKTE